MIRSLLSNSVEVLMAERDLAREKKNFALSDYIRDRLSKLNIKIKDTKQGSEWRYHGQILQ